MDGCCSKVVCFASGFLTSDVHRYIAIHQCRFTITATKDSIGRGSTRIGSCSYCSSSDVYGGIKLQYSVCVCTAIDGCAHRTAFHVDGGVAEILGSYDAWRSLSQTTTENAACYSSSVDVDHRCLAFTCRVVGNLASSIFCTGGIYCTEGTAAIYIA